MEIKPAYTDSSLMMSGKYKFTALCRVPAEFLLDIYKQNKNGKYPDKELIEYIEKNLEAIKARKGKPKQDLEIECRKKGKFTLLVCKDTNKIIYISEKDAKSEINRTRDLEQSNKKPVRSYECEKCGGWHLTSISHEVWEKISARQKPNQL